jgi:hypothetical protein
MRRGRTLHRGRWLSLLAAGVMGYLLGDWHASVAVRSGDVSASQSVALRFPEGKAEIAVAHADEMSVATLASTEGPMLFGGVQVALLSPTPMMDAVPMRQPASAASAQPVRLASADPTAPVIVESPHRAPAAAKNEAKILPAKTESKIVSKAVAANAARRAGADRQGFVLNDAQIASIKGRLHLSPDQEQMWPAVEAALRNIAYAKTRGHGRGADSAEIASLDPYGPEVQGLKSAAFPLIMSFSDDQRSEVRTVAHAMGLDQLASQF